MPTGHISFTDGQVPTTAEWNGRIAEQVVGYYATEAARNSRVSTPLTGMVCCVAGRFEWYDGTGWVSFSPRLAHSDASEDVGTNWWGTGFTLPPTGLLTITYEDMPSSSTDHPLYYSWQVSCARIRARGDATAGDSATASSEAPKRVAVYGTGINIYAAHDSSNQLLIAQWSGTLANARWEFWL